MSPEFESRRQRRELEAQQAAAQASPQYPATPLYAPAPLPTSSVAPASFVAAQAAPAPIPAPTPASAPVLSRRELRQQQQQSAAAVSPTFASPSPAPNVAPTSGYTQVPWVQDLTPQVPSTPTPTWSQAQAQAPAPTAAPTPTAAPSRRELRDQLRQPAEQVEVPVTPFAQPWSELPVTPMFETSSGFSIDTTTNSVVLPITPDALAGPLVIESGVTLRTGSIELPNLNAGTGSIALPTAAQIADDALGRDSASSYVSSIAPVAARGLLRKNPKLDLAPVKTKGSQGQLFYGLTTAFLMLTVGALLVGAWMFGVIK